METNAARTPHSTLQFFNAESPNSHQNHYLCSRLTFLPSAETLVFLNMDPSENILDLDLCLLDYDQLLDAAKCLRKEYQDCRSENAKREEELKRLQADHNSQRASSFPSSICSFESLPGWIRAELDSPGDTSWSCLRFRQRSKFPTVIVYDQNRSSLEARGRETLKCKLNPDWRDCSLLR